MSTVKLLGCGVKEKPGKRWVYCDLLDDLARLLDAGASLRFRVAEGRVCRCDTGWGWGCVSEKSMISSNVSYGLLNKGVSLSI